MAGCHNLSPTRGLFGRRPCSDGTFTLTLFRKSTLQPLPDVLEIASHGPDEPRLP